MKKGRCNSVTCNKLNMKMGFLENNPCNNVTCNNTVLPINIYVIQPAVHMSRETIPMPCFFFSSHQYDKYTTFYLKTNYS